MEADNYFAGRLGLVTEEDDAQPQMKVPFPITSEHDPRSSLLHKCFYPDACTPTKKSIPNRVRFEENVNPDPSLDLTPIKTPVRSEDKGKRNKSPKRYPEIHHTLVAASKANVNNSKSKSLENVRSSSSSIFSNKTSIPKPEIQPRYSRAKPRKPIVSKPLGVKKFHKEKKDSHLDKPDALLVKSTALLGKTTAMLEKQKLSYTEIAQSEFDDLIQISKQIQELRLAEIDASKEAKRILIKDEEIRQTILKQAATGVNVPFSEKLYNSLMPIDVVNDDVAAKIAQENELKIKSIQPQPRARDPAPSLSDFVDDSIYEEWPTFEVRIPAPDMNKPVGVPTDHAFSQYKRTRMWDEYCGSSSP